MGARIVWTCDGCDRETVVRDLTDWKMISVTFEGFGGYPCGDFYNGKFRYHLCPSCQRSFVDRARPTAWPRAAKEGEAA